MRVLRRVTQAAISMKARRMVSKVAVRHGERRAAALRGVRSNR